MGEAREAADRMTAAMTTARDLTALAALYSEDAVVITPDQGEIRGREAITENFGQLLDSFSDTKFESVAKYEVDNTAIDEGYFIGTNTGPLQGPSGESMPATGKQIRVRDCDVVVVDADGLIREHRFYWDQMEFLGQLGLLPETSPSAATE
jgi:ketosteroid isomerase-like protein